MFSYDYFFNLLLNSFPFVSSFVQTFVIKESNALHYLASELHHSRLQQFSLTFTASIFQVKTAAAWKDLYFNVITGYNDSTIVTVEGGGVNATVITPNIAATNGFIHIIDRVLGVPYTTVLDKLRTDPMLKWVKLKTYFPLAWSKMWLFYYS